MANATIIKPSIVNVWCVAFQDASVNGVWCEKTSHCNDYCYYVRILHTKFSSIRLNLLELLIFLFTFCFTFCFTVCFTFSIASALFLSCRLFDNPYISDFRCIFFSLWLILIEARCRYYCLILLNFIWFDGIVCVYTIWKSQSETISWLSK